LCDIGPIRGLALSRRDFRARRIDDPIQCIYDDGGVNDCPGNIDLEITDHVGRRVDGKIIARGIGVIIRNISRDVCNMGDISRYIDSITAHIV